MIFLCIFGKNFYNKILHEYINNIITVLCLLLSKYIQAHRVILNLLTFQFEINRWQMKISIWILIITKILMK